MSLIPFKSIPSGDGPIDIDTFASAVSSMSTKLWVLKSRLEGSYENGDYSNPPNPDALDDDEKKAVESLQAGLSKLAHSVLKPAMVKLAEAIPEPEPEPEDVEWTPRIDRALDWNGPVRKVLDEMEPPEAMQLALAIMEGFSSASDCFVGSLMEAMTGGKINGSTYRFDDVHECPRCEGNGSIRRRERRVNGLIYVDTDHCRLCNGRGAVFYDILPDRIEQERYLSTEGKLALNEGKAWTLDDELDAWGYSSREEAEADHFEPADFLVEPAAK